MFEQEISQTLHTIIAKVLKDRAQVPLTEILESPEVPERFKPFFETEVYWWLYNESLARNANKRFDYRHPELSSILTYLEQVQFRHANFEREDFTTVLDSAVKLTYNYICRPQTTLKWYIFRGEPVKPLEEVMLRFSAFTDYRYFRKVFLDWLRRKQKERPTFEGISSNEFERIIRRIDDQILLSSTIEDLLVTMSPLFDFIGKGEHQEIPIDALVIFFDDKNIRKLVVSLEEHRHRGFNTVRREDFVELLDELLRSAGDDPEADFSMVYQNDELDDVVREHLEEIVLAENDTSLVPDTVPEPGGADTGYDTEPEYPNNDQSVVQETMGESFPEPEAVQHENMPEDRPQSPPEPHYPDTGYRQVENDMLPDEQLEEELDGMPWLDDDDDEYIEEEEKDGQAGGASVPYSHVTDEEDDSINDEGLIYDEDEERELLEPQPYRVDVTAAIDTATIPEGMEDVRNFIDGMLERKVVKKVFNKNRVQYETALELLNAAETWREASRILDELFIQYNVDPYSRTAIRFTDSIYGRYLTRVQ